MLSELTNHLWQSTIFAAAAGLMTIAFRKNRAQVRYWLWLSASLKFLLPFSSLMSLGGLLHWAAASRKVALAPAASFALVQVSQPFSSASASAFASTAAHDWIVPAMFVIWAFGFAAIVMFRFQAWRRIRAAVRSSTALPIPAAIDICTSPGLLEPGVVGLFRPVLLLPAGIAESLTARQLEAVLRHELCHVRRRDNFTSALHMIVEALFWFHPLVWWIGARLIEERERACDEAVVSSGSEPRDYAAAILKVCKIYLESPLSCVAGVTGSDLKKRIHAILSGRVARDLTFAKKLALSVAGMAALATPIAIGTMNASAMQAQSPAGSVPKFESFSVKPCNVFGKSTRQDWPSTEFHSECTTVDRLIEQAYGLFADGHWNLGSSLAVTGGPAWTASDFFQVNAKTSGPQYRSMINGPMLQALLQDSFRLKIHRESRDVPVYTLTIAEGGPRMPSYEGSCTPRNFDDLPSDNDCGTARATGNGFRLNAATVADLCAGLLVFVDRPVIDHTGLTGRFNMQLDFDLSDEERRLLNGPRSLPALTDPTIPLPTVIPSAAAKSAMQKLGLNLETAKGPGDFVVIDYIERPLVN